jgi:hypothetical protein
MSFAPKDTVAGTQLPESFRILLGIAMLFSLWALAQSNVVTDRV